jgi:hypothetical protein
MCLSGIIRPNRRVCLARIVQSRKELTRPSRHNLIRDCACIGTLHFLSATLSGRPFLHRVVNSPLRLFERQTTSHEEKDSLESVQIARRVKDKPRPVDSIDNPFLLQVAQFLVRNPQLVE